MTGILMFPAMLLGPAIAGLLLTRIDNPREGLRNLFRRMFHRRVSPRWFAVLLIPPVLVLATLFILKTAVSHSYSPNFFLAGVFFGVPAGFLEEIGWTGYAFPSLRSRRTVWGASILLGLLWSLWHLPVIDFLGSASPHGKYLWPFFAAFATAMTAMRVLICWLYSKTDSVLLAQLLHISSTGSLVVFGPPAVAPGQETMWYGLYGVLLWLVVAGLVARDWS